MQWIVVTAGLMILVLLAGTVRRPSQTSYRDAPLEDALSSHLAALAQRMEIRGWTRIPVRSSLLRSIEKAIAYLNELPANHLLPASRWLRDNGRFLQEEATAVLQSCKHWKRLPRCERNLPRLCRFCRELAGHANADITAHRLKETLAAWQSAAPMTDPELNALSDVLRITLLEILAELALQIVNSHRAASQAERCQQLFSSGHIRRSKRLMIQRESDIFFLERLLCLSYEDHEALQESIAKLGLTEKALVQNVQDQQSELCLWVANAVSSLRVLSKLPWSQLIEEASQIHASLSSDAVYRQMDMESRAYYRRRVARLARRCHVKESAVCSAAASLCRGAEVRSLKAHSGYYLLDEGLSLLLRHLQAFTVLNRFWLFFEFHSLAVYRIASWTFAAFLLAAAWYCGLSPLLWLPFSLVSLHAFQQVVQQVSRRLTPPRMIPRLQLERLDQNTRTLVVCPAMLTDKRQALAMVKRLLIHHEANPDEELHFLLLGDYQDSLTGTLTSDADITITASTAIDALCKETGHPFLYLQRERIYSPKDRTHHSRERKRGGVETVLKLIEGKPVEDVFAYSSFDPNELKGQYRYVITLDSDSILPPGSALRMIGSMLHPLQQRLMLDGRMRGVSILQPRMGTAAHTVRSRLSALLGAAGGTDPYNQLTADFDQDILRRGTFMGKGIIDPPAFLAATEGAVLKGCVLSHDMLEGELAGCAFASDVVVYDSHPQTLQGFLFRQHRWTRGDWQLLPYVLPFHSLRHKLDKHGKWKVWRNLLRSLAAPARCLLLIYAAVTGRAVLFAAFFLMYELLWSFPLSFANLKQLLCRLAVLPCEAVIQTDAIIRAVYRQFISRSNLLEWTTAAQIASLAGKPPMVFFYASMGAAGLFTVLSFFPSSLRLLCWGLAICWAAFPFVLPLLEQERHAQQKPTAYMRDVLMRLAQNTLTFFETAITQEDHSLPPDHIQLEPNRGIAHRTSPTNIGLYLCSLLAAEKLRLLSPEETAKRVEDTVCTLEMLPKWNGLFFNWYDTRTLAVLPPALISSVDCGNLAVCLLTCAQGIRNLLPEISAAYSSLSARLDALVDGMQLNALYDPDADLFYISVDPEDKTPSSSHYDLLASEARLLSFVAIMLRQVPVRHWFRLGRPQSGRVLVSYSGTMFEYLMPVLFHPLIDGTLLAQTCREALTIQKKHTLGGAFGVSESGYYAFDPELHYQYKAFGIPKMAFDASADDSVLTPYASMLALTLDLKDVFRNLHKLKVLGMEGPLGLFEAADFAQSRTDGQSMRIIRSHMAHHQGMILCAICNALEENHLANLFSALPRTEAYQLLLEEYPLRHRRMRQLKTAADQAAEADGLMQRDAQPLAFPIDAHVLHGGATTLLIDAQGGGYISRNGVMLTRFSQSCQFPSGIRFYLRDSHSGAYWMVSDPHLAQTVRFETAQAVFSHSRFEIACELRVWVNPLDGTVVHMLTLENTSKTERLMEVCSFLEPTLAAQAQDETHPAFQNLFVQTERLGKRGVAVIRRPKKADEQVQRLWHTLNTDQHLTMFRIQTDRAAFQGRNRTILSPRALDYPISATADTLGDVIDPCASLRGQFTLPSKGKAVFLFATHMPEEGDGELAFCERYSHVQSALRGYDTALTKGIMTARFLGLRRQEQLVASKLTGALAYLDQPSQFEYASANALSRRYLWKMGISGDLPILVVDCTQAENKALLLSALKTHAYLRTNGFWVDLVVLVPRSRKAVFAEELVEKSYSAQWRNTSGGVFLFDRVTDEERQLLYASARLILSAERGTAEDQLDELRFSVRSRPLYACRPATEWKAELPPAEEIHLSNGYGGFTKSDGNYQITLPPGRQTPAPWCNPLCSETFGTLAGESGLVFSYARNSHSGRLTRWPNDAVAPRGQEVFYVRDQQNRLLWSLTRSPLGHAMPVRITHAPGETVYEASCYGIYSRMQCFTDIQDPAGVRVVQLRNDSGSTRTLTLFHSCIFSCGIHAADSHYTAAECETDRVWIANPNMDGAAALCAVYPDRANAFSMSSGLFQGLWGNAPFALSVMETFKDTGGNTAVLSFPVTLHPQESCTVITALSFGDARETITEAIERIRLAGASRRLHDVRQLWEQRLGIFHFDLPDQTMGTMLNRWIPYQVHASRLWMRAGFYQAGGAYGFRDQLQDMLSLLHTQPQDVRSYLLECAQHQFEEGDVQHWWHPPRTGVRTRITDDKLFLPYVTSAYVEATADASILDVQLPYLQAPSLQPDEHDRYFEAELSPVVESLRQHCLRAIASVQTGVHGLPLMGGGDWNDGMDQVGGSNGESVWLGMFLCEVLRRFSPLCDEETKRLLMQRREELLSALERYAWDGKWYLRAWYHNGQKLGGSESNECRIDLLSQSWAVFCGLARERSAIAMENVWNMLYEKDIGICKLFAPPFNGEEQPGYIAGYLPGIRENGGQYTHAACWAMSAFHQLGQEERAWELAFSILPAHRAATRQQVLRYRVEPYALAADVYANSQQRGRGGWTWYTGSAGWYYTVLLTQLFGFQKHGSKLRFRPTAPAHWDRITITYRYGHSTYHLHASRDCAFPSCDGKKLEEGQLELTDDGRIHEAVFSLR